jgi:thiol-disulfide isomerase/thioredoxin
MKNCVCIVFLMLALVATAQPPPPGEVRDFSGMNVVDDKTLSLSEFQKETGVVIIFRGNECPFDEYYTQRIVELVREYRGRVAFLLVNPYLEPAEAIDKMKMYSTVWGMGIPYLADKDQSIMAALGARKTPEAFVLKNAGDKFTIVYSGAIDDNPQLPAGVKQKHLQSAIEGLLSDQTQITSVRTTGCTIRKK